MVNVLVVVLDTLKLLFNTEGVKPLFTYKENVPEPAVDVLTAAAGDGVVVN